MRETVSGSYKQKGLVLGELKVLRELMRSGLGLENSKESRPLSEPLPILAPCLIRSGFKVLESEWLSTGSSAHFLEWQGMGGTRIRLLLASIIVDVVEVTVNHLCSRPNTHRWKDISSQGKVMNI